VRRSKRPRSLKASRWFTILALARNMPRVSFSINLLPSPRDEAHFNAAATTTDRGNTIPIALAGPRFPQQEQRTVTRRPLLGLRSPTFRYSRTSLCQSQGSNGSPQAIKRSPLGRRRVPREVPLRPNRHGNSIARVTLFIASRSVEAADTKAGC
jgi:hypothetical protein